MAKFTSNDQLRAVVWSHLVAYPGLTASELLRSILRDHRGNNALALCKRMEQAGQLTSEQKFRSQQGREVTCWYAVPGAFVVD